MNKGFLSYNALRSGYGSQTNVIFCIISLRHNTSFYFYYSKASLCCNTTSTILVAWPELMGARFGCPNMVSNLIRACGHQLARNESVGGSTGETATCHVDLNRAVPGSKQVCAHLWRHFLAQLNTEFLAHLYTESQRLGCWLCWGFPQSRSNPADQAGSCPAC